MVASELVLVVPLTMEDDTLIEDYKSAIKMIEEYERREEKKT